MISRRSLIAGAAATAAYAALPASARLGVNQLSGFNRAGATTENLNEILVRLGHTADACWDFGASECYDGSAQDIFDLTANNHDAWRGADNSATTNDPTFNGVSGGLSSAEYFSFDAGDFFTLKTQPAFIQLWHKDGATKSFVAVAQVAGVSNATLWGTSAVNNDVSSTLTILNTEKLRRAVGNGTSNVFRDTTAEVSIDTPVFVGIGINENGGATASAWNIDSTLETFDDDIPAPSSSDAGSILRLGSQGTIGNPLPVNSRMYMLAFIDGALTGAQLDTIRDELFGVGKRFA